MNSPGLSTRSSPPWACTHSLVFGPASFLDSPVGAEGRPAVGPDLLGRSLEAPGEDLGRARRPAAADLRTARR